MNDIRDYFPKWTKKVITEGGGRDPLGLSRVAFILTDYLLNGIITTTERARYYSFYTWALWHIGQEEKPTNYDDFVNAFRRREAVMALSTYAANPAMSPVGVEVVRSQLDRGKQTGEYDCNFKVLPSNNMGGYGQYYGGSIYALKLTDRDDKGIDHASRGFGEDLAVMFDQTIRETEYIRMSGFLKDSIAENEMEELQACFTLDAINTDLAKNERAKLIEIFFGLDENLKDEKSTLRCQTLTILLHLIDEYGKHDSLPDMQGREVLDEYLLYAIYYEVLWLSDDDTPTFEKLKGHDVCYELWKQFCLHQFVTQALEYLLFAVIETVGHTVTGLSLDDTVAGLIEPTFLTTLKSLTGKDCRRPCDLLSAIDVVEAPTARSSAFAQETYKPGHSLSEAQLLISAGKSPQEATATAVVMLAVLFAKWRGKSEDTAMSYVSDRAGHQVWAGPVLRYLDTWLDPGITWTYALNELIENLVLNQHDRIMYEKRRLDSSWLHRAGGKIIKDQDYGPTWRASRFSNAVNIMADLSLVSINESREVAITREGTELVANLSS